MDGKTYQELAMRTCSCSNKKDMFLHGLSGLAAEAGEVNGVYQKKFQGHTPTTEMFIKEIGDCMWMCAELAESLGTDLDVIMETNIEKLKKRYPDGFEVDKSLHRAEGDI